MLKTLNTYLINKVKSLEKDQKQMNSYVSAIRGNYNEHNFELTPKALLSNLTDSFPVGNTNADYELGIKISTSLQLFSELNIDEEIIEIEIISFLQNKLIPYALLQKDDLAVNNIESIIWALAEIGTEQSLTLIETICSDKFYQSFPNHPHLISACLYAYKKLTDKKIFEFFDKNYSKIQNIYLYNEDALIEKKKYYSQNNNNSKDRSLANYYSYLLELSINMKNKNLNKI